MKHEITKCPHCDELKFVFIVDDNNQLVASNITLFPYVGLKKKYVMFGNLGETFFIKTCKNCGFSSLFNTRIIDN